MKKFMILSALIGLVGCGDATVDSTRPGPINNCDEDYVAGFDDGVAECETCDAEQPWHAGYEVGYYDGFKRAAELHGLGTPNYCWREQYVNRIDRDPALQWEQVRYECR